MAIKEINVQNSIRMRYLLAYLVDVVTYLFFYKSGGQIFFYEMKDEKNRLRAD